MNFNRGLLSRIIPVIATCSFLGWCSTCLAGTPVQRVLVLHSYHQGLHWTDSVHRGIETGLKEADSSAQIFTEYLESIRMARQWSSRETGIVEYLRAKYSANLPDVVIVSDDDAFNFMLRYRDQIVPGKPLVFCGINNLKPADISRHKNLTGVAETPSFAAIYNLILKLQPAARRVFVIGDKTATFRSNHFGLEEAAKKFVGKLSIEYSTNTRIDQVEAILRQLSNDTGVLLAGKLEDESGNALAVPDATRRVAAASPVPVFAPWEFRLGHGIIGGELVTGDSQGRLAGELTARLLRGEPIERIPPVWDSPNQLMFDHRVLLRFGFTEGDVPTASVIINRPPGFLDRYWLLLTIGLTIILSAVTLNFLHRRRAAKAGNINLDALTVRERDVVQWVGLGKTNAEIATLLSLSENTVKHHLTSIFGKLHIYNRAQLVRLFNQRGQADKAA